MMNAQDATNTQLAVLHKGSIFGEIALIFGGQRNASIRAITFCEFFSLAKDAFDAVCVDFPGETTRLIKVARKRMEATKKGVTTKSKRDGDAGDGAGARAGDRGRR